MNHK